MGKLQIRRRQVIPNGDAKRVLDFGPATLPGAKALDDVVRVASAASDRVRQVTAAPTKLGQPQMNPAPYDRPRFGRYFHLSILTAKVRGPINSSQAIFCLLCYF